MLETTGLMVFYENMLALNNINIKCGQGQIVGVFGANSAGKSTLMYTLSGIMQDIQKKEAMAGGERIFDLPLQRFRPLGDPTRHLRALCTLVSRAKDEDVSPEAYRAWSGSHHDLVMQSVVGDALT